MFRFGKDKQNRLFCVSTTNGTFKTQLEIEEIRGSGYLFLGENQLKI